VALSRADVAGEEQLQAAKAALAGAAGRPPLVLSAATGHGVEAVLDACLTLLASGADAEAEADPRWSAT
jgi:GTP-binding protein